MVQAERTFTPQEAFKRVGHLENLDAIASISLKILNDSKSGLWAVALTDAERELLGKFDSRLKNYAEVSRASWAELKEDCLLLIGSQVAAVIDHLVSAMRTPAIAESAIRSAGFALIQANEAKAKVVCTAFMRSTLASAMGDEG